MRGIEAKEFQLGTKQENVNTVLIWVMHSFLNVQYVVLAATDGTEVVKDIEGKMVEFGRAAVHAETRLASIKRWYRMLRLVVFTVVFANFLNMFLHPCKPRYYCSCGQIDMLFCAVLWANGCKWVFLQKRLFGGFLQTAPFYTCLLDFSAVFWREQLLLQKRFCGCEYWCTKARNRCSWGVLYISGHASTKCWKEQAFWCEMLRDAAAKIVFALFCAHERAKQVPHQHHHL